MVHFIFISIFLLIVVGKFYSTIGFVYNFEIDFLNTFSDDRTRNDDKGIKNRIVSSFNKEVCFVIPVIIPQL